MSTPTKSHRKKQITRNLQSVQQQLVMLKTMRGRPDLSERENLDVLHVYLLLCGDYFESESCAVPVNAVSRAAKLLGRSKGTASTIVKAWNDQLCGDSNEENSDRTLIVASNRLENRTPSFQRKTNANSVYREVRDLVGRQSANHEQVTATEVF